MYSVRTWRTHIVEECLKCSYDSYKLLADIIIAVQLQEQCWIRQGQCDSNRIGSYLLMHQSHRLFSWHWVWGSSPPHRLGRLVPASNECAELLLASVSASYASSVSHGRGLRAPTRLSHWTHWELTLKPWKPPLVNCYIMLVWWQKCWEISK